MFEGEFFSTHQCSPKEKEEFFQGFNSIMEYAEKFTIKTEYVTIPCVMENELYRKLIDGLRIEYHTPEITNNQWSSLYSLTALLIEMEKNLEEEKEQRSVSMLESIGSCSMREVSSEVGKK